MSSDSETYYTIRQAAEATGSSVPRFYSNKDKFSQFKLSDGKRSDYAIPHSYLIQIGWLNPDGSKRKGVENEEARGWIERNEELKSKLNMAEAKIRELESQPQALGVSEQSEQSYRAEISLLKTKLEIAEVKLESALKENANLLTVFKQFGDVIAQNKTD